MKAYLYNTENGIYEGETFEDADTLQHDDGITTVPPPEYEHGQVVVFDCGKNEWAVIPISIAHQLLKSSAASGS